MRRGWGVLAGVAAVVLAAPGGTACGATVRIEQNFAGGSGFPTNTTVHYEAAPGEANRVVASRPSAGRFRIVDSGATIAAPEACQRASANDVTCPADLIDLQGGDGDDQLEVPGGNANGGPGDDLVVGSDASDFLRGGGGHDTLRGLGESDLLQDDDGVMGQPVDADVIDGGAGTLDQLRYNRPDAGVNVDLSAGTASDGDRLSGVEWVVASGADSTLAGSSGNDRLQVFGGRNVLTGGAGDDDLVSSSPLRDQMSGGPGDDFFDLDPDATESDQLSCGPGYDRVVGETPVQLVPSDCELVGDAPVYPSFRMYLPLRDLRGPIASGAHGRCGNHEPRNRCVIDWYVRVGRRVIASRRQILRENRLGPRIGLRLSASGRGFIRRRRVVRAEIGVNYQGRRLDAFRIELRAPVP